MRTRCESQHLWGSRLSADSGPAGPTSDARPPDREGGRHRVVQGSRLWLLLPPRCTETADRRPWWNRASHFSWLNAVLRKHRSNTLTQSSGSRAAVSYGWEAACLQRRRSAPPSRTSALVLMAPAANRVFVCILCIFLGEMPVPTLGPIFIRLFVFLFSSWHGNHLLHFLSVFTSFWVLCSTSLIYLPIPRPGPHCFITVTVLLP